MDLQKWVDEWVTLDTEEQRKDFDKRFRQAIATMSEDERLQFEEIFYQSAVKATEEAKALVEFVKLRRKLEPILDYVSLSEISKKYFGKTRQWLYQRINEYDVNGKPAKFTKEEIEILRSALEEIAGNIKRVARSI
jgi:hypothetical protein